MICTIFYCTFVLPLRIVTGYVLISSIIRFNCACCRFAGSFCGVVYVFTLPGVVDVVSRYRRQESVGVIRIVIHVFIFLIGISNLIGQFIMYKRQH